MDYSQYARWQIVRLILDDNPANVCTKQIAAYLETSESNVAKWGEDPTGSGSDMPSKYIKPFSQFTNDTRLVDWFRFTSFPNIVTRGTDGEIIDQLLNLDVLRGTLSKNVMTALEDKFIDSDEAATIRDILGAMSEQIAIARKEIDLMECKQ